MVMTVLPQPTWCGFVTHLWVSTYWLKDCTSSEVPVCSLGMLLDLALLNIQEVLVAESVFVQL